MNWKWLPNAMCAGRAVLGVPIAYLPSIGEWWWAFWAFAIAVLLDMFDGAVARALKAESTAGKDWYDPLADAIMSAGAMIGLIVSSEYQTGPVYLSALMLAIGIPLKYAKHESRLDLWHKLSVAVLPICYTTTIIVLLNIYLYHGTGNNWRPGLIASSTLIPAAIFFKKNRLQDWFSGQR